MRPQYAGFVSCGDLDVLGGALDFSPNTYCQTIDARDVIHRNSSNCFQTRSTWTKRLSWNAFLHLKNPRNAFSLRTLPLSFLLTLNSHFSEFILGDEMEFDEVFFCQEAKHNVLQMPNFCPNYCYTDHMFGIWNKKQPNMYFLGTTRPYTGAFGCNFQLCLPAEFFDFYSLGLGSMVWFVSLFLSFTNQGIAEVNAMFVHRMITDAQFARGISDQFPAYMHRQRVTHYVQASEPDKLHVHWAGMCTVFAWDHGFLFQSVLIADWRPSHNFVFGDTVSVSSFFLPREVVFHWSVLNFCGLQIGSSMIFWPVRHILRVSQVLGCELSKEGAKRHGLEKEWMTGPINALRCRIVGPYALPDAAARYRKSCEKLGTNYMYLNMIYRIWGDTCLKKEAPEVQGPCFGGLPYFFLWQICWIPFKHNQCRFASHSIRKSSSLSPHCFMFVWFLKYLHRQSPSSATTRTG